MLESSIIIPVSNGWELTRSCLKSISANTDRSKIEVIVVDNASADATEKGCVFLGRQLFGDFFRYIRNDVNRNFAGASNQGAEAASGEYLIFLDNDTEVQPGWYEPLINDFTEFPDIAATGPLLVYPDDTPLGRTVQHLGVCVNPFNQFEHYHERIPAASPLAHKRRFFQAIAAACMVIKRELFLEAGKFNEEFINGLEDIDLCARLGSRGLRMTVNPASLVIRHESQSGARHANEARNGIVLARSSLNLLKPDRHLLLRDDGLALRISKWFVIQSGMLPADTAMLDAQAPSMDAAQLKETIIGNPYWQTGWLELLRQTGSGRTRSQLWRLYLEIFHDADNALALVNMPWADQESDLLAECIGYLRFCIAEPETSFNHARAGFKWALAHRIGEVAEQFSDFIKDYDQFRERDFPQLARELWRIENRFGVPHAPNDNVSYMLWRHLVDSGNREKELADFYRQVAADPESFPSFSVLVPVYNPSHSHLRAALDSVLAQTYPAWELCIADDASSDPEIMKILREYAEKDARIHVTARDSNGHIAAATNTALAMAQNPWTVLLDQDDLLTPDALAFMARAIVSNPQGTLFFSDEDKLEGGQCLDPHLKNGKWDWELIPVQNYVCHLAVYNTERLRSIGGLREGFAGAQDHDLVLRYAGSGDPSTFIHVPHVLYHWRIHAGSTAKSPGAKSYALESGANVAQDWLDEHASGAKVSMQPYCLWPGINYPLPSPLPTVSLICAASGPRFDIKKYLDEWRLKTARNIELIIVCREGDYQKLANRAGDCGKTDCRIVAAPDDHSICQLMQLGAANAAGSVLGFVGDGITPKNSDWLDNIVSSLCRPGIGAVGGRITDKSGALLHGGYLADASGGLKRIFMGAMPHSAIWFGWTMLARTVDALDCLCLFTKADTFRESGGFNSSMGDWAGQDYCLRLGEARLRTVWQPHASFLVSGKSKRDDAPPAFTEKWKVGLRPFNENILIEGKGLQLCTG